ncbi:MAG: hypothetical protein QGI86_10210 [Candidatus Poribacteria bacterium]|nr:hypothetical protein [Candidatus Poribacteria bacterium]MDP6746278.1 hypothetical protein [Candidatus Poribacteria bacterium]MDP6998165.1 hypothetical protein [Candidatus Poribacteria bacterium]
MRFQPGDTVDSPFQFRFIYLVRWILALYANGNQRSKETIQ